MMIYPASHHNLCNSVQPFVTLCNVSNSVPGILCNGNVSLAPPSDDENDDDITMPDDESMAKVDKVKADERVRMYDSDEVACAQCVNNLNPNPHPNPNPK